MNLLYETDRLISIIYNWMQGFCKSYGISDITLLFFIMLIVGILILAFVSVNTLLLVLAERKVSAWIQDRLGPMRVGPQGILQTVADAVKLLQKEDIVPIRADKLIHLLAPIIVFVPAIMVYAVISWSPGICAVDLNLGILYIFALGGIGTIGIILAGWSSGNKWSLLGGMRSGAQIISYEIPLLLSIIGVVMISGTFSLKTLIESQKNMWFIGYQPLGFLIFLIAGIAEVNRAPFDLPEAESELVAGFHTEYSGMKFALFFLAEYANMFVLAVLVTTLFLGGWNGIPGIPIIFPPIIWFLAKVYFIIFLIMWFRWTYPRIRVDQLMGFGWKFLVPLSFLNIAITGIVISIRG
ncbi:TPA: NADH-quinone oxidoreductase subunit NuoH [bacterium]|nr:NADH-quinone oxidoreductase subunit NuoH [bacterium]